MSDGELHYRVIWSDEDREHIGLCDQFPSLSWLAPTSGAASAGIRQLVDQIAEEKCEGE
jgi:hypothetical protein